MDGSFEKNTSKFFDIFISANCLVMRRNNRYLWDFVRPITILFHSM